LEPRSQSVANLAMTPDMSRSFFKDYLKSGVNLANARLNLVPSGDELLKSIELAAVAADGECNVHFVVCFLFCLEGSAFNTDILICWPDFVNNF
jgi:hypothetical protein